MDYLETTLPDLTKVSVKPRAVDLAFLQGDHDLVIQSSAVEIKLVVSTRMYLRGMPHKTCEGPGLS